MTGQAVFRGARDGKPNLNGCTPPTTSMTTWRCRPTRKRLPLLFYSESRDIGVVYPWVHLPGQVYGWEIVNYNGANLLYRGQFAGWSGTANVFGGSETNRGNGYWTVYNGKDSDTDSRWTGIAGAELVLSRDWFEGRIGYVQSKVQNRPVKVVNNLAAEGEPNQWMIDDPLDDDGNPASVFSDKVRQKIWAASANVDYGNWVLRAEYIHINRRAANETDISRMFAAGYRIGKWLPLVTLADYRYGLPQGYVNGDETVEAHRVASLAALRPQHQQRAGSCNTTAGRTAATRTTASPCHTATRMAGVGQLRSGLLEWCGRVLPSGPPDAEVDLRPAPVAAAVAGSAGWLVAATLTAGLLDLPFSLSGFWYGFAVTICLLKSSPLTCTTAGTCMSAASASRRWQTDNSDWRSWFAVSVCHGSALT